MGRFICLIGLSISAAACLLADGDVVFKSDVALSRVDVQVVGRDGRALTDLQESDFVLRVDGKVQPIRNFHSEDMPIDILLLLDVSGSMQPHVQRIADAAQQALEVLARQDRIAVMVFDTSARERLPFTDSREEVTGELNRLVRSESFDGGTRITSSMIQAAGYLQRHARPDARRAIVILTDDETQDSEDEPRVENALARANAILSFLQAPYEPPDTRPMPRGGRRGGGGFPGGGGIGFPGGGGVGVPGGGSWPGGGGIPGTGGGGPVDRSHTAGTDTVARDSGGDTMPVNDASALADTFARLRQRYSLNFYLAGEAQAQVQHAIRVDLSTEARIRFADAEVRSRRVFMSGGPLQQNTEPVVVSHQTAPSQPAQPIEDSTPAASGHRRVAVNEESEPGADSSDGPSGDADTPSRAQSQSSPSQTRGGWPRATADKP